jgi:hypothetical protein
MLYLSNSLTNFVKKVLTSENLFRSTILFYLQHIIYQNENRRIKLNAMSSIKPGPKLKYYENFPNHLIYDFISK